MVDALLKNGPRALGAARTLIHALSSGQPIDDATIEETALRITARRIMSAEARKG